MSKIACWPVPSQEILNTWEGGGRIKAIKAYREAGSTLADGTEVVPSLSIAKQLIEVEVKHGLKLPVAIEEGHYQTRESLNREKAAEKLKYERFAKFMEDVTPGIFQDECDACGKHGEIQEMYAPDGMGYPTVVMHICNGGC